MAKSPIIKALEENTKKLDILHKTLEKGGDAGGGSAPTTAPAGGGGGGSTSTPLTLGGAMGEIIGEKKQAIRSSIEQRVTSASNFIRGGFLRKIPSFGLGGFMASAIERRRESRKSSLSPKSNGKEGEETPVEVESSNGGILGTEVMVLLREIAEDVKNIIEGSKEDKLEEKEERAEEKADRNKRLFVLEDIYDALRGIGIRRRREDDGGGFSLGGIFSSLASGFKTFGGAAKSLISSAVGLMLPALASVAPLILPVLGGLLAVGGGWMLGKKIYEWLDIDKLITEHYSKKREIMNDLSTREDLIQQKIMTDKGEENLFHVGDTIDPETQLPLKTALGRSKISESQAISILGKDHGLTPVMVGKGKGGISTSGPKFIS